MYILSPPTHFKRFKDGANRQMAATYKPTSAVSLTKDIPLISQRAFSTNTSCVVFPSASPRRSKRRKHLLFIYGTLGISRSCKHASIFMCNQIATNQHTITIPGVTKTPLSKAGLFCSDSFVAMYSSVQYEPTTQLERAVLLQKTMIDVSTTVHG
jgi:hypothetical protein